MAHGTRMSASDQTGPGLSSQPAADRQASETQSHDSAGPGPTIGCLPAGCLHSVFDHLPPQALCCVSCVCRGWRDLNHDAAANQAWRAFYERKWPAPASAGTLNRSWQAVLAPSTASTPHLRPSAEGGRHANMRRNMQHASGNHLLPADAPRSSWQAQYGSKMWQARSFGGRFDQDTLHGHQASVRSLAMLPGSNLLATGSSDRTVKLWDLRAGMPVATSKLHGGPVRAVAMDATMLVSSGFHDRTLRVWEAGNHPGTELAGGFDLSNPTRLRNAHTGPILTLALTDTCLFSGGWDYAVRIWARQGLACAGTLAFDDWVWCVAPRGDNLLVSAGVKVHVHDLGTGRQLRRYDNPHGVIMNAGSVVQVEGSRDGRLLFSGAAGNSALSHDLSILAHDLRLPATAAPVATLWQTGAGLWGLSHEDPWLGAALNDGTVVLLNAEAAMRQGNNRRAVAQASVSGAAVRRQLQCGGRPAHCVSVGDQWLAAGSGDAAVRTWDFSRAEERAEASRAARQARYNARQQRGLRAVLQRQAKPAEAAGLADAAPDDVAQESTAEAWPSGTAGGVAGPDGGLGSHLLAIPAQQSEAALRQGGCGPLDCDAADQVVAGNDGAELDSLQSGSPAMPLSRQTQSEALTEWQEDSLVSAQRYRPAPGRRRLPRPHSSSVPGPVAPRVLGLDAQHVPGMQTWQIVRPRRTSSSSGTIPGETNSGITVKVKG